MFPQHSTTDLWWHADGRRTEMCWSIPAAVGQPGDSDDAAGKEFRYRIAHTQVTATILRCRS